MPKAEDDLAQYCLCLTASAGTIARAQLTAKTRNTIREIYNVQVDSRKIRLAIQKK